MARIISIVNQKGGTGKSACTANLAVGLAQKNMKVLIVDADPQSDVSAGFGYRDCDESNETLTALMDTVMKDEDIPSDCYIRHQAEGIDIICSNIGLAGTEVKIRGHRIELGEIESVLKSISRIKEAVVVAQGDKYHKELVAFYLGEYIAESEIEDYLKIHLPEYSIPNSINRLENFPLNANGKVDRRRLAEYQKTDSVEIMSDKVLNIVLMIWEELLKNKVADLDENLFKIGADSLLAARFVAAINARCGIEVRMKEVFMNPSINALTKLVDKRKNTDIAEFVEEGEI